MKKIIITTVRIFREDEDWEAYKGYNPLQIDFDALEKDKKVFILQTVDAENVVTEIELKEDDN